MEDIFEKASKVEETIEIEDSNKELEKLKAENEELKKKMLYIKADNDNIRKNANKKIGDTIAYASSKVISELLEPLDDLERAFNYTKEEGLGLALNKLKKVLENNGLTEIETANKPFDSELHEAVSVINMDSEKYNHNEIVDCVQKGYMVNGKVVRHSRVVVHS